MSNFLYAHAAASKLFPDIKVQIPCAITPLVETDDTSTNLGDKTFTNSDSEFGSDFDDSIARDLESKRQ